MLYDIVINNKVVGTITDPLAFGFGNKPEEERDAVAGLEYRLSLMHDVRLVVDVLNTPTG